MCWCHENLGQAHALFNLLNCSSFIIQSYHNIQQNDSRSSYLIARCYIDGPGPIKNFHKALQWLEAAVSATRAMAILILMIFRLRDLAIENDQIFIESTRRFHEAICIPEICCSCWASEWLDSRAMRHHSHHRSLFIHHSSFIIHYPSGWCVQCISSSIDVCPKCGNCLSLWSSGVLAWSFSKYPIPISDVSWLNVLYHHCFSFIVHVLAWYISWTTSTPTPTNQQQQSEIKDDGSSSNNDDNNKNAKYQVKEYFSRSESERDSYRSSMLTLAMYQVALVYLHGDPQLPAVKRDFQMCLKWLDEAVSEYEVMLWNILWTESNALHSHRYIFVLVRIYHQNSLINSYLEGCNEMQSRCVVGSKGKIEFESWKWNISIQSPQGDTIAAYQLAIMLCQFKEYPWLAQMVMASFSFNTHYAIFYSTA